VNSFGSLKLVDFQVPFSHLGLVIQAFSAERKLDGVVLGLPIVSTEGDLQSGLAGSDSALRRASFARGVGNIDINTKDKLRIVLFSNLRVRFGNKFDFK